MRIAFTSPFVSCVSASSGAFGDGLVGSPKKVKGQVLVLRLDSDFRLVTICLVDLLTFKGASSTGCKAHDGSRAGVDIRIFPYSGQ